MLIGITIGSFVFQANITAVTFALLSMAWTVRLSVRLSVCLSVRLSVRLSVCPSVCLSVRRHGGNLM